jgi:hypothetical protein
MKIPKPPIKPMVFRRPSLLIHFILDSYDWLLCYFFGHKWHSAKGGSGETIYIIMLNEKGVPTHYYCERCGYEYYFEMPEEKD